MSTKKLLAAVVMLGAGIGVGRGMTFVDAQEAGGRGAPEASAWEIYHGPMPDQSDNAFYVIKHNRATGETLVLSVVGTADDDAWYRLPTKDAAR